jgi:ABC-type antimicrobial peptide transport system permease subunit
MSREIASGLAIGLLLIPTVACSQSKRREVGNVTTLAVVTGVTLATVFVASLLPALKASSVDPVKALKSE